MAGPLNKLTIEGFKSIKSLRDFPLRRLNVLIGPNGAGKSNFVGFFRLLHELINQRLQLAVSMEGGADACLFLGPKETKKIEGRFYFGDNGYEFSLIATPTGKLVFEQESTYFKGQFGENRNRIASGHEEARLADLKDRPGKRGAHSGVEWYVFDAVSSWIVYHFHDTSANAAVRRPRAINDNISLRQNAENLAPFLLKISETNHPKYERIRDVVRLAAPFFDDFLLRPMPSQREMIQLEWKQKGSDYPFRATQLSDGTLRFICMATALLQPEPPPTMFFDEPELGLHPYALTLLGNLFRQVTLPLRCTQVIISTQSALLLNEMTPEDVVVVERMNGQSQFRRLKTEDLSEWLEDYSLGELWQKNVLGARPVDELTPQPLSQGGSG